jgi:hypothetical protein
MQQPRRQGQQGPDALGTETHNRDNATTNG